MAGFQGQGTYNLITAASADETLSQWIDVRGRTHLVFYVIGNGTTSSGVVTLDESVYVGDQPYGGTPSAITTVNASTVTGDNQAAIHPAVGTYGWVRARISTAIGGGGTVSVVLVAV